MPIVKAKQQKSENQISEKNTALHQRNNKTFCESRQVNQTCSLLVFSLIGFYCLLASMFYRSFAEVNIQLPFLNFPIFVGEIVLGICLTVLITQWKKIFVPVKLWHGALFFCGAWVLMKAFTGYQLGGALAFRNAALFYYALFAVVGYCFYKPGLFGQRSEGVLLTAMLLAKYVTGINNYYVFPYLMMTIILSLRIKRRWLKYSALLLSVFTPPHNFALETFTSLEFFVLGGRARVMGHVAAFLFLGIVLLGMAMRGKGVLKGLIVGGLIILFAWSVPKFLDKQALKSMTHLSQLIEYYKQEDAFIKNNENFEFKEIPSQLYSKTDLEFSTVVSTTVRKTLPSTREEELRQEEELAKEVRAIFQDKSLPREHQRRAKVAELLKERGLDKKMTLDRAYDLGREQETPQGAPRVLRTSYSNILFRIFIWRDMFAELINEKAFGGISFGKPQRSRSIEILEWASPEWTRDGWITPHNSFLHLIYRGGIIGAGFFIGIFVGIGWLIRQFIRAKSLNGLLLTSIFVYWLVVANFTVFLELPYNAIPFWALLGMTFGYYECKLEK